MWHGPAGRARAVEGALLATALPALLLGVSLPAPLPAQEVPAGATMPSLSPARDSVRVHQQTCPASVSPAPSADSTHPTVLLDARVSARELRFDRVGSAHVNFTPCTPGSLVRVETRGLPERVQPGVTYRDVAVRVLIRTDVHVACGLGRQLGVADSTLRRLLAGVPCDSLVPDKR